MKNGPASITAVFLLCLSVVCSTGAFLAVCFTREQLGAALAAECEGLHLPWYGEWLMRIGPSTVSEYLTTVSLAFAAMVTCGLVLGKRCSSAEFVKIVCTLCLAVTSLCVAFVAVLLGMWFMVHAESLP